MFQESLRAALELPMPKSPRNRRADTQDLSDLEITVTTDPTEGPSEISELAERRGLTSLVGRLFRLSWADSEPVDHDRGRELRRAVRGEDVARVRKMLRDGVGVNESQEASLACIATRRRNLELLEVLIDAGVDLNQPDRRNRASRSRTPLQEAARKGWVDGVELLLRSGAKVDIEDEVGATALLLSVRSNRPACAQRLLAAGANPAGGKTARLGPLHEASTPEMATLLLDAGADLSQRDASGATALHHQAKAGRPLMIDFLLSRGASIDAVDDRGRSPLFFCGAKGDAIAVFERLIKAGADLSIRDEEMNSFLHLACTRCLNAKVLEALHPLTPGIWQVKNRTGETPVDILKARGLQALVERVEAANKEQERKASVVQAKRYSLFDPE